MQKLNPTSFKLQSEKLLYASFTTTLTIPACFVFCVSFGELDIKLERRPHIFYGFPLAVLISYKRLSISELTISVEQKIDFLDYSHAV